MKSNCINEDTELYFSRKLELSGIKSPAADINT